MEATWSLSFTNIPDGFGLSIEPPQEKFARLCQRLLVSEVADTCGGASAHWPEKNSCDFARRITLSQQTKEQKPTYGSLLEPWVATRPDAGQTSRTGFVENFY